MTSQVTDEAVPEPEGGLRRRASARRLEARSGWRLTRIERFRYYLGSVGWMTGAGILNTFLSIFLVLQGMSLAAVGTLILVVKVIDAVDDLVFGYMIDRFNPTQLRFIRRFAGSGKYLPWYRVTFFLLPLATVLFFAMPSGLPDIAKMAWFAFAYLLYDLSTTMSQVPIRSMIVTLTDNVIERDNILKVTGVLMVVFGVSTGLIWQVLISEFVGWSVASVAIGSAIIALLLMVPLARGVQERNVELKNSDEAEAAPRYTIRQMAVAVRTNKFMMLLLASDVLRGIGLTQLTTSMFAAFFLFQNSLILTVPVLIAFVPGLVLQLYADRIVHLLGKRNTIVGFSLMTALTGVVLFFVGPDNVMLVLIVMSLAALPGAMVVVVRTFMIPDTIEYTRYKTGQDCAGIFYALESFVQKASSGIASAVAMFLLGLGGWVAVSASDFGELAAQGVTQPAEALTALWMTISLIPALGGLACAVTMLFYRLRDQDAALMAKCNSGEISREECEAALSRQY
jgi:Na+/melibiose symporter-like transporter